MQQQFPDQHLRISTPEQRELVIDRLRVISAAVDAVMSASEHPTPDTNHFQRKQHDTLLSSQTTQQQAKQEYTDNVNRNLHPETSAAVDTALTATVDPVAQWQTESMLTARQQVDKAHQDFPLPQEHTNA